MALSEKTIKPDIRATAYGVRLQAERERRHECKADSSHDVASDIDVRIRVATHLMGVQLGRVARQLRHEQFDERSARNSGTSHLMSAQLGGA